MTKLPFTMASKTQNPWRNITKGVWDLNDKSYKTSLGLIKDLHRGRDALCS